MGVDLIQAVADAFVRHRMRPENGRVVVACSGGPDSRTLLDALLPLGLTLYVASVDHGLRPEASEEAAGVEVEARGLGLSAAVLRVTVEKRTMASARRARYTALVEYAQRVGAGAIAVGHTATDQAETLLDRMLRGTGLRGLGAMSPVRPIAPGLTLIRPLLAVPAADIEAHVAARNLRVVRDPTNRDRHYRRSRMRHELLPLLRRERADADAALAELASRLREDSEALDEMGRVAWLRLREDDGLDVDGLMGLPPAVRARVLMRACPSPLESVHLQALASLCRRPHGTRYLSLPGGLVAERAYGRLRFGRPPADPGDVARPVDAPGTHSLFGVFVEVPADLLAAGPLVLRNLRPGDRVPGGKKLKEILIDRKIPRAERRLLPLLARGNEVLWMYRVFGDVRALTRKVAVQ
jgi:tRNA(Ile)-lysidine synthase